MHRMTEKPLSKDDINFFLHLGYFPNYEPRVTLDFSGVVQAQGDVRKDAVEIFRRCVADDFESGARHVVPLSGGLDSRAILCALMDCTEVRNIETYTFGTPGSRDFEMGTAVAKAAGVQHRAVDLSQHDWSEEELFEIVKRQHGQTFLFHHIPLAVMDDYQDAVIWSGYIGDAVTGGHCPKNPATDLSAAKRYYWARRAESGLFQGDLLDHLDAIDCALSFEEKVLFAEVGKVTAPHVLMDGLTYKTPFINNDVFNFFIGLSSEHRIGRRLFREAFEAEYEVFQLPSTANVPLWRRLRDCLTLGRDAFRRNYFDFEGRLKSDENFAALIQKGLEDLQKRHVVDWIDFGAVKEAKDIKILYSLEMNFKVREEVRG